MNETPVSQPRPFGLLHKMTRLSNQRFEDNGITNLEIGNEEKAENMSKMF